MSKCETNKRAREESLMVVDSLDCAVGHSVGDVPSDGSSGPVISPLTNILSSCRLAQGGRVGPCWPVT